MKIKADYANAPQWKEVNVKVYTSLRVEVS